jgi:hypothetical protein
VFDPEPDPLEEPEPPLVDPEPVPDELPPEPLPVVPELDPPFELGGGAGLEDGEELEPDGAEVLAPGFVGVDSVVNPRPPQDVRITLKSDSAAHRTRIEQLRIGASGCRGTE